MSGVMNNIADISIINVDGFMVYWIDSVNNKKKHVKIGGVVLEY